MAAEIHEKVSASLADAYSAHDLLVKYDAIRTGMSKILENIKTNA